MTQHPNPTRYSFLIISLLTALAGCTVPAYDDQTDKLISTLQSDVDTEIVSLITEAHDVASGGSAAADAKVKIGYAANKTFYDKVDVELMSIKLRVDGAPNLSTTHIDDVLQQIRDNILSGKDSLQYVHQQQDKVSENYAKNERVFLAQQFQFLLSYELILKNGTSASSNGASTTNSSATPTTKQ